MELQVGVKVLLRNPEGRFLLLQRSSEKYPDIPESERWDIVGGRIEPGSTLLENLEREIMEETGLKLHKKPKVIGAQDIFAANRRHIVRITYLGETVGGEVRLDEDQTAYKWLNLKEIKDFQGLDAYVKELLSSNVLDS